MEHAPNNQPNTCYVLSQSSIETNSLPIDVYSNYQTQTTATINP